MNGFLPVRSDRNIFTYRINGWEGYQDPQNGARYPSDQIFPKKTFFQMIQTGRNKVSGGGRMDGKSELKMAKNVSSQSGNTESVG